MNIENKRDHIRQKLIGTQLKCRRPDDFHQQGRQPEPCTDAQVRRCLFGAVTKIGQ